MSTRVSGPAIGTKSKGSGVRSADSLERAPDGETRFFTDRKSFSDKPGSRSENPRGAQP